MASDLSSGRTFLLPAAGAVLLLIGCQGGEADPAGEDAASAETSLRFTDVTADSGITFRHHFLDSETGSNYQINPYDHGSGVFVADVDGDGLDDLFFLDFLGPNALYRNLGGMRFEDVSQASGLTMDRALSVGAAFADYDGDGDQDVYVTTYRGGNFLYANSGDGTFTDVTAGAGVGYDGHSNSATWFDYDLDGDVDLYLCNIGKFTTETISQEADFFYAGVSLPFVELAQAPQNQVLGEADILFRNEGDGTFSDVTEAAGIVSGEWNGDAAVADVDLDGDPDLYTSNMFGANHLFLNQGDGTFEEVTDQALQRTSWGGMGARFFDGNGDEYPDLYVVDMHSDMWMDRSRATVTHPRSKYNTPLGARAPNGKVISEASETITTDTLFGNTYFENNGDGTFSETSTEVGLESWWPWGIVAGDFDNDGDEDLFVASGMGFPFYYWPNQLFENAGGTFREVAQAAGIEPPAQGKRIAGAEINGQKFTRSSRCAATADFDGDGDLDIVVNNFNHEPYLLRNDAPASHALRVRLRGAGQNGDAVGARLVARGGGRTWTRQVTGAQGYLSQSSAVVHVGTGDVATIDSVEVFWPGETEAQTVLAPDMDRVVDIVQP